MKKTFTLPFCLVLLPAIFIGFASSASPYGNPTWQSIKSNLYIVAPDATTTLVDGDLTQYDTSFSNDLNGMDARKLTNPGENIGMLRGTTTLAIERRHTIENTDTIFYKIWNLKQTRNYQLEFIAVDLNQEGLSAVLEDSYLKTSTPVELNDSTHYNFSINGDAASYSSSRFRIIFTTAASAVPLPITFTLVKATENNSGITIDWQTTNEKNLDQYSIEKSNDGKSFSNLQSVKANNLANNNYNYTDAYPSKGNNYYRIKSMHDNGSIQYSATLKIFSDKESSLIKIFPNPVTGNSIHLQMINHPEGSYSINLVNLSGQIIHNSRLQHNSGNNSETIILPVSIPKGIYQLQVIKPDGTKEAMQLISNN